MKKLIIIALALFSFNAYCQTATPFVIEHCIDKMTDKEYFLSSKNFVCTNSEKTKGFVITNQFKGVNGNLKSNGLIVKNIGIGNCDEKDELIFLFDDDTKITITSWNKFNCEGKAYFDLSESDLDILKSKKVTAIRFKNGYSYDSLTYVLKKEEQGFFINVYTNYVIKEINCDN
jgi:hypothetical protein